MGGEAELGTGRREEVLRSGEKERGADPGGGCSRVGRSRQQLP